MSQEKDIDSRIALLLVFTLIAFVIIGVISFGASTVLRDKEPTKTISEPIQITGAVISFYFEKDSHATPDEAYTTAQLGSMLDLLRTGGLRATLLPFNGLSPATAATPSLQQQRAQNIHSLLLRLGVPQGHIALGNLQTDPTHTQASHAQRVELVLQAPPTRPSMASVPLPIPTPPALTSPQADVASVVIEDGVVKFYFASGSSTLANEADVALGHVIAALRSGQRAIISGFTDPTGNAEVNERLAKERAFAVRDVLIRLGAPETHIELERPQSHTGTGNNAQARRVEVRLAP